MPHSMSYKVSYIAANVHVPLLHSDVAEILRVIYTVYTASMHQRAYISKVNYNNFLCY